MEVSTLRLDLEIYRDSIAQVTSASSVAEGGRGLASPLPSATDGAYATVGSG